uniref:Uncharacterized protein n=1 Tax=viral metagenome TaxID=1070528 RepID=A0A6C0EZP2_9ZZZZ
MDTSTKIKKVGTREEVFKGIAIRTAGGLKKDDIIEKKFGSRILYISKKLSEKMKENITILRAHNPNIFKKLKKTMVVATDVSSEKMNEQSVQQTTQAIQPTTQSIVQNIRKVKRNPSKTQKLSFKVKDNSVKNVYYPELQGVNLKELKAELLQEEAEEDLGIQVPKQSKEKCEFKIEEMPDFNIDDFE